MKHQTLVVFVNAAAWDCPDWFVHPLVIILAWKMVSDMIVILVFCAHYCCWFQLPLQQANKIGIFLPPQIQLQLWLWISNAFIPSKNKNSPKMPVIAIGCNIILTHFCVQWSIRKGEMKQSVDAVPDCLMHRNRWVAFVGPGLFS